MQVFTNKHPLSLGYFEMDASNRVKRDTVKIDFPAGKVFKLIAISACDVLLEGGGETIVIPHSVFNSSFIESEIDV